MNLLSQRSRYQLIADDRDGGHLGGSGGGTVGGGGGTRVLNSNCDLRFKLNNVFGN